MPRSAPHPLLQYYASLTSRTVPVDATKIRTLYVFVEITVDRTHLAETVAYNFPQCCDSYSSSHSSQSKGKPQLSLESPETSESVAATSVADDKHRPFKLAAVGTVQFLSAVQGLAADLASVSDNSLGRLALPSTSDSATEAAASTSRRRPIEVLVPQVKPLSPGEVLGCTAPRLPLDIEAILYVGDGRFHLESIMLANPTIPAFRYDPYEKRLSSEGYEHAEMREMRDQAVKAGHQSLKQGENWGIVLGTLGRQGSLTVLKVGMAFLNKFYNLQD